MWRQIGLRGLLQDIYLLPIDLWRSATSDRRRLSIVAFRRG